MYLKLEKLMTFSADDAFHIFLYKVWCAVITHEFLEPIDSKKQQLRFRKDSNSAMKASLCIAGGIPEGICIEYLEFIALSPTQFA